MSPATLPVQPAIPAEQHEMGVASQQQPMAKAPMNMQAANETQSSQNAEVLRLRGGCPGRFCGLPILPCRCDICIIPIPCC